MKGLNEVKLIGNLGADPVMKYLPSGKAVTNFTLATSRKWKTEQGDLVEDTQWHNIVCYGPLAENVNNSLNKGSAAFVSGRLNYQQWEDKEDKTKKHYKTEIVCDDVIFLDKPPARDDANNGHSEKRIVKAAHPGEKSAGEKMVEAASEKASQSKLHEAAVAMGAEPVFEGELVP